MSFLNLPLEVRLKVYSYVFGHGIQVIESNDKGTLWGSQPQERSAQLLCVSRAVCNEATSIFFDQTIVQVARKIGALGCINDESLASFTLTSEIRHLVIEFDPTWFERDNVDENLMNFIRGICVPEIEDTTLSCFAMSWLSRRQGLGSRDDTGLTFEVVLCSMRILAASLFAIDGYTRLEEHNIPERKIVMKLFKIKGQAVDDGVRRSAN